MKLQIWSAKKLNKIQSFQNIALRKLINVPALISNHTLLTDLKIKTIHEEAKRFYNTTVFLRNFTTVFRRAMLQTLLNTDDTKYKSHRCG